MCESTFLILREEHWVLNYVYQTTGRTLCVKLCLSYYGKNIMCETTSLILREEPCVCKYVSNTKGNTSLMLKEAYSVCETTSLILRE